jgi:hypothetical protein
MFNVYVQVSHINVGHIFVSFFIVVKTRGLDFSFSYEAMYKKIEITFFHKILLNYIGVVFQTINIKLPAIVS